MSRKKKEIEAEQTVQEFSEPVKTREEYEREIYDLQQLLEISRSLCTTLELHNLIESILYISMAQMRVLGAGVFILNSSDSQELLLGNNYNGFEVDASINYTIPIDSKLIAYFTTQNTVFTLDELKKQLGANDELRMLESLHPTLIVPLILKNHVNGLLILGERFATSTEDNGYTPYEKKEIYTLASLASIAVNNASLVEQSSTDMMTHLKLKHYFFNVLTDKLDSATSDGQNIAVMMFDIDFFKKFNDTYGHACGDYVLQEVAQIIKKSIRSVDMASRYGGEEFTVLLGKTNKKNAMAVAERIRKNIATHDFFYQGQHMNVTISCGVALFDLKVNPVASAKILVDQADQALYVSKRSGRNCVTFADAKVLEAQDKHKETAK
ncbi:MAG: GGDEF domain-containing protein [Treponema sp.]|nr:GGDEF domain-containing protein [Treponema sp.]MBP5752523.1 GGDEF domain-containing protein [Treponema sp.]